MKALVTVIASSVALLAPAASAAAGCPGTGKTVVKNGVARVWGVHPKSGISRYYGCAFKTGKVLRLDPKRGQLIEWKPKVKLAGTTVAFEALSFDLAPYRVYVKSLRTGRTLHSAPSNKRKSSDGHTGPVSKIVLKRSGSVAWTTSSECICEGIAPSPYEVHAIGTDNKRRMLDTGVKLDPASLALTAGNTQIRWLNDGATRTARLD